MTRNRRQLLWLAAAVVASAGCRSGGGLPAIGGPTALKFDVTATEMRFTPSGIAVAGSDVPVVLQNKGTVIHDLRIEGKPSLLLEASSGQTSTATWALATGRYRFYCSIPGHRAAGMEGVLEVR